MAFYDTTRPVGSGRTTMRAAGLFGLVGMVADWNDARQTRHTLSRLSDRELNDLGFQRGDLEALERGVIR